MTSPIGLRSRRRSSQARQPIFISVGVIILAAVVLVCVALLAVPLWTALVQDWEVEAVSDPCALNEASARQDCFDLRLGESRHPAKGANAPIRIHPSEQRD